MIAFNKILTVRFLARILAPQLLLFSTLWLALAGWSALVDHHLWPMFLLISGVSGIGALFIRSFRPLKNDPIPSDILAAVPVVTVSSLLFAALPFFLSGHASNVSDALFESSAALTRTALTTLNGESPLASSLTLYRAVTPLFGCIFCISFFMSILPILGMGGIEQLRPGPVTLPKDRITLRFWQVVRRATLWFVLLLGALFAILFYIGAIEPLKAFYYAIATVSGSGYLTNTLSDLSPLTQWVCLPFMLIVSLSFPLLHRLFWLRDWAAVRDLELRVYVWLILVSGLGVGALLGHSLPSFTDLVRVSLFTVVNSTSGSGFPLGPESQEPLISVIVIVLSLSGAMGISTTGGIKLLRSIVSLKLLGRALKQTVHPRGVFPVKIKGSPISSQAIEGAVSLILLFGLTLGVGSIALIGLGVNPISSVRLAVAALCNTGTYFSPAAQPDISPLSVAHLSAIAKLVLTALMIIGKLEFFSLLVVFTSSFWRR